MNKTLQRLEDIRLNGFYFGFGEIFDQTFQNYKKTFGVQGLVLLVIILLFTVVIGSVAGLAFGVGEITEYFTDMKVNGIGSVALIVQLIVSVIGAGLTTPFTAGLLKMSHLAEENKEFGFSTAFEYYKSTYFKELFLAGIYMGTFLSGLSTITNLAATGNDNLEIVANIINFIFQVVFPILAVFTIQLIIFGNLPAIEALKASIIVAKTKFWTILFLFLVVGICACLGIFGLCLGIFFTFPVIYSLEYIMYRTAFGIEDEHELDQIGIDE